MATIASLLRDHVTLQVRSIDRLFLQGYVSKLMTEGAYAPFPVWLYLNGHEWAKRQAARQGLCFEALDNGFRSCADAPALADICARLSARDVEAFMRRWQARLPSPFSAEDRRRGYRYSLAFRQLELSDTRVFDRPQAGRAWFEQTIRDQLTLGRPDQTSVVFGRRISAQTPGRFHTRVINRGVEPAIQVHYRASKVKQYFKEGRALRTETTVNDTRDFGIGRLLTPDNWEALVRVGHDVNERLLSAQLEACACAPDATTLERVVLPSSEDGQPAPGLRFGDPRVMALMACLCAYSHLLEGLTNRSLRALVAGLLPGYTTRQMTYALAPPAAQGLRPPHPTHPALRADQRGPAARRLLHEDLHADPQPLARRTRPEAARGRRTADTARASVARVRTRT